MPSRSFATFDPVLNSYLTLANPVALLGDWEFEFEYESTNSAVNIVMGDNHLDSYYFNLTAANFGIWIANAETQFPHGGHTPFDGKMHKVLYKLTGTNLEVFFDGNSLGSQTVVPYTGVNNFRIGDSNNVHSYFNGILSDVIIRDLALGVTHTIPVSEPSHDIEFTAETTFGADLTPANAAGWNVGGTAIITDITNGIKVENVDGWDYAYITNLGNPIGTVYLVEFEITNLNVSSISVGGNGGSPANFDPEFVNFSSIGTYSILLTSLVVNPRIKFELTTGIAGNSVEIINIRIREITNYSDINFLTYNNLPGTARETYTLDQDGNWLGENFWQDDGAATVAGCIVNGDGTYTSTGTENVGSGIRMPTSSTLHYAGMSYIQSADILSGTITGGTYTSNLRYRFDGKIGTVANDGDSVGTYTSAIKTATTTGADVRFLLGSNSDVTIGNLSVRRALEVVAQFTEQSGVTPVILIHLRNQGVS